MFVFISSHDQNIGPINLIGLFSTQALPTGFHVIIGAPKPRDKIWEGNQLVLKMCSGATAAYRHVKLAAVISSN